MSTKRFTEAEVKAIGGLLKKEHGIPYLDEIIDLGTKSVPAYRSMLEGKIKPSDYLAALRESCRGFREANSETGLGFLLRKGVQATATDWYHMVEKAWPKYARPETSTGVAEWYAPLYNTTIPTEVQRGGRFSESRVAGEDSSIRNRTFGQVVALDRTLFDDDQTGQLASFSQKLGEGMGVLESVWLASKFIGAKRTYANVTVPASAYTTTDPSGNSITTPFSSTLYGASSGNRPGSFGILNMGHLQKAYATTLNTVDPFNNKILVKPNRLLVSNMDALHGDMLIKPGPYPAVLGNSDVPLATNPILGGSVSAAGANQGVFAGFPGAWGAPNPLGGLGWELAIERYFPDWAWALGEAGKGFIMQVRDPLEIIEEQKNSGSYFDFDSIRYRSRERFEADWIGGGSRFWFLGNDGSTTGLF